MMLSAFDIFKIGIGPSSSHTVGPMRAALLFARSLEQRGLLARVARLRVDLFGSLGATGHGHATDQGVILGLFGDAPDTVRPETVQPRLEALRRTGTLMLLGTTPIAFDRVRDIVFRGEESLPEHPNAMRFTAFATDDAVLAEGGYFSVGGGFVVEGGQAVAQTAAVAVPHPFSTGDELMAQCRENGLSVAALVLRNECAWRPEAEVRAGLLRIWGVMQQCVQRGFGIDNPLAAQALPGPLRMRRRAGELHRELLAQAGAADPLAAMDWVNAFAMAVNEENAAGGRVVTAPTNGAAGVVPAVMHYYQRFVPNASDAGIVDFLLTAAAIGMLYKTNASISGAEVGCQGEVGVACSMAAGALAAVLGGTPAQVENAAEIGMEHNLGLTCDPVGGMVQIPCVERNAMGAVKAINAARMALRGDGSHYVSLDAVIRTMKQTGEDMKSTYKETSLGGLAVNVVEC
ncbi:serine dehydratase [Variovorax paradoxus]|uniref:L-serine ammonia-lyase n=1 Tax=Variovorax paradoxus TaxID=34073 RepID=UPI0006E54281|nr:serine dehydratase [Variovorax paradoxus]KPV06522.1 serine dehydratase [Variovorax paradoxus]KPV08428.1 serine dehydratase [Variovorax paradoxus]KPV21967.1 serine dehydratase [Variovorax paradoxus]KPV32015.1 serine dehydratase [Variovorax paradoxus]